MAVNIASNINFIYSFYVYIYVYVTYTHAHYVLLSIVKKMDLRLISASSGAGEPAGCVLMYRLDGEGSPHGLPVVGETYPWAGKTICALRDR